MTAEASTPRPQPRTADVIACARLTRRFGEVTAVDDLTFNLPQGAIAALLGPNGAGKSTSLNMLAGILAPSEGAATVAGVDIRSAPLELKRRIGVVPEALGLFDDLTVEEHLLLTGSIYGVPRSECRTRVHKLLHTLDLEDGRNTFASACSHGMRKKTALAMALLPEPRVLLLDEPFEGIDPITARIMESLLVSLSGRGVTTVIASHMLGIVERIATHFMIMRSGRIVWSAQAGDLAASLDRIYLNHIGDREGDDLAWIGSSPF